MAGNFSAHNDIALPPVVERFFKLAPLPDSDEYFGLFGDDVILEDEGKEYRGISGVRQWRKLVPLVSYDVTGAEGTDDAFIAVVTIAGDFPGSPADGLEFRFESIDDTHIHTLRIR